MPEMPERIGPYKILDQLGEGGMAVVYLAEQTEPVRRRIALKILKPGMDTKQVITRFESERQALAVLDHPHIAKVYDGGVTENGRPYFVMELVRGVPITDYCDKNRLNTENRVRLFIDVCSAVQHAHHKGLIHRDLKPSNLLVGVVDGKPEVKIIDFGIAKASGVSLSDDTLVTRIGQIIGTPQYMSPEQADSSGIDIDTRSDVYSLGVVLYEMLVGIVPISLAAIGDQAMRVILREKDPPKPSTRVTELGDTQGEVARARRTDPDSLRRQLKGDLDWIVMQAIAKDRTQRYETANALALDCRRFLRHEPVTARPPSPGYLLRRFVRRNKLMVTAAGIAFIAVLVGAGAATLGFIRATEAEQVAKQQAATATAIAEFLVDLFQISNPWTYSPANTRSGTEITAREVLDKGAERLRSELADQPEVRSGLMNVIGQVYLGLGLPDLAEPLVTEGLEIRRQHYPPGHVAIGDSLIVLGQLNLTKGQYADAAVVQREAVAIFENAWGADARDLSGLLTYLAVMLANNGEFAAALEAQDRALRLLRQESGVNPALLGEYLNNLGYIYNGLGRFEDAINVFREAVDLLEKTDAQGLHSRALGNLGAGYIGMGRVRESKPVLERAYQIKRDWFGPDHFETGISQANLSFAYHYMGDYEHAAELKRASMEVFTRHLGANHQNVAVVLAGLGWDLRHLGRYEEAEQMMLDGIERLRASSGPDAMQLPTFLNGLAEMYIELNRFADAKAMYEESLRILNANEVEHPEGGRAMAGMATLPNVEFSQAEREELFQDGLDILARSRGPNSPETASVVFIFALYLHAQGRIERAMALYNDGLTRLSQTLEADNPRLIDKVQRFVELFGQDPAI